MAGGRGKKIKEDPGEQGKKRRRDGKEEEEIGGNIQSKVVLRKKDGEKGKKKILNGMGRWGGAMPGQPLCLALGQERSKAAFGPCLNFYRQLTIKYTNSKTMILYKLSKIQFYLAFSDISTLAGQISFPVYGFFR